MSQNSMEILLEYFNKMLHDPDTQPPDLSAMEESCEDFGEALCTLQKWVHELWAYSEKLAIGNLSASCPSEDQALILRFDWPMHLSSSFTGISPTKRLTG